MPNILSRFKAIYQISLYINSWNSVIFHIINYVSINSYYNLDPQGQGSRFRQIKQLNFEKLYDLLPLFPDQNTNK